MIPFDHETYDILNLQNAFRLKPVHLSKKRHSGRNTRTNDNLPIQELLEQISQLRCWWIRFEFNHLYNHYPLRSYVITTILQIGKILAIQKSVLFFHQHIQHEKCRCTEVTWVKIVTISSKNQPKIKYSFPKSLCSLKTFRMEGFVLHFVRHQPSYQ